MRKQQLTDRAYRYAYGVTRDELYSDDPESTRAANAWQDGYRAAMRDLRKVVKAASAEVPNAPSGELFSKAVERVKRRNMHVAIMTRAWLKPLR